MGLIFIITTYISLLLSLLLGKASIFACTVLGYLFFYCTVMLEFKKDKLSCEEERRLCISVCIAFLCCVLIYFGTMDKFANPYWEGVAQGDEFLFEDAAQRLVDSNQDSLLLLIKESTYIKGLNNCKPYIWLMSKLMRWCNLFGGYHVLCYRFINLFLTAAAAMIFYKEVNARANSNYLKALILFPNLLIISSFGFRDIILYYFLSLTYKAVNKRWLEMRMSDYFLLIISACGIWGTREESFMWWFVILGVSIVYHNAKEICVTKKISTVVLFIFCLCIAYVSGVYNMLMDNYLKYTSYLMLDGGLSSVILRMKLLPFGIVFRFAYGLVQPFPSYLIHFTQNMDSLYGIFRILVSIGTIWQIVHIPYLFRGIKMWRKDSIIYLGIFMSLVLTTYGFRHFMYVYPFMFEEILMNRKEYSYNTRNTIVAAGIAVVGFLGFVYLILKCNIL